MKKILLAAFLLFSFAAPVLAGDEYASVYDRVMKTRTLRCAYTLYPTFVEKDPNTGEMSGMFYDLVNELGKQLDLKIEWADEVGSDVIFEGFKNHRYDAVCPGYFSIPSRAWGGYATKPFIFRPVYIYVRADETRFITDEDLNNPSVSVSLMDGEGASIAAEKKYPLAKKMSLPGITPATDRFEIVASGKADFTPMEASIALDYMDKNSGKIKQLGKYPLSVGGSVIFIPHYEDQLKAVLDTGIESLQYSGALEQIVRKYEKHPEATLLPALPYQLPEVAR